MRPEIAAVLGAVKGNLHDIAKNLLGMVWKGANIEAINLGTNVPTEGFVEAAKEHSARTVGISALLTTPMVGMRDLVTAARTASLHDVKVIVGGAQVTADFTREIGADAYAADAGAAVGVAHAALRG